jgi:hypothetical protein
MVVFYRIGLLLVCLELFHHLLEAFQKLLKFHLFFNSDSVFE